MDRCDLDLWLKNAAGKGILNCFNDVNKLVRIPGIEKFLFPASLQGEGGQTYALFRTGERELLGVFYSRNEKNGFCGTVQHAGSVNVLFCPLSHENAVLLRKVFPFTAPSTLSVVETTFGAGDRLGLASTGHIEAFKKYRASPVLAQQSVLEIELTGRSFEDVLDSATWAVFSEGYRGLWGADGDHLKTEEWVEKALSTGFTMITADVSDYIRNEYAGAEPSVVLPAYRELPADYRRVIEENYSSRQIDLDSGYRIKFSEEDLARAALMYGEAVNHSINLYRAGACTCGEGNFDFELSIDETPVPTSPQAHYFIGAELERNDVKIFSVAPRFPGDFQKGIDYSGDIDRFEESLSVHTSIASRLGYKISVHSGSDKFLIYPSICRITEGRFHIKTSGTSWLEALRIISLKEHALFRLIYESAKEMFPKALKYYNVTPDMNALPSINNLGDKELSCVFMSPDARQVLHVTYGELLGTAGLRKRIFKALENHREDYRDALCGHIGRHLEGLGVPEKNV